MPLREINEGKGWTRIEKWRWWWPFWTLHEYKYTRPDPAPMLIVPKDYKAERTARGFAEIKKLDQRKNPGQSYRPIPKKYEPPRKADDRRVDRSDSSDFVTGVIVGSLLGGGKSDPSPAPSSLPDITPGGGDFGGGGASGSWDSDSSSSSSSSSYDSGSSSSSSFDSGGS